MKLNKQLWRLSIKLIEDSKYHVKHYIRKQEKRLPFFVTNLKNKTVGRGGLGVETKQFVSLIYLIKLSIIVYHLKR